MTTKSEPLEVVEISSDSDNEENDVNVDLVENSFHSCMFPSSTQLNVAPTNDDSEVQFISSESGGPGDSSNDPILLTDSPSHDDTPSTSNGTTTPSASNQDDNNRTFVMDLVAGQLQFPGGYPVAPAPVYSGSSSLGHYSGSSNGQIPLFHPYNVPHFEYQIRFSFPVRPTPIYRFPSMMNEFPADDIVSGSGASQRLIEECSTKTRFIKRMPPKSKTAESKRQSPKCAICLEEFVDKVKIRRLRCIHNFHVKCIDEWLKKNMTCPTCRRSISII